MKTLMSALVQYRHIAGKKLIAIHAAESKETVKFSKMHTGRSEVDRIMEHLKPDFVIHMTNATGNEMSLVAKNGTGVVICPRVNGVLGAGIQKLPKCSGRYWPYSHWNGQRYAKFARHYERTGLCLEGIEGGLRVRC